ncbi:hypothetical protein FSP39_021722 [Pinctada imbricata]|uniref:G-protein coupled receptors family 1 profile domain-containing protein n=1 Tax=Pinctada imbricata TaxID=66713 RepID=A0AA88YI26_PINIB|nr:hypothetical protein FSP39_021722 [Pinctada imbricata]
MNETVINKSLLAPCYSSIDPCEGTTGLTGYACFYFRIHGYVSLILCCFGVPTNIANIVILTRKSMRSQINFILTGIAVSDVLTMLSYIPFALHFYIINGLSRTPEKYSYGWSMFLAIHACLSITTHTISIWLGVWMSCARYIYIRSMGIGRENLSVRMTCCVIILIYALSICIYIPYFCYNSVVADPCIDRDNVTIKQRYGIKNPRIADDVEATMFEKFNIWIFILLGKWIPCILITVFGGLLLYTLHESKKRTLSLKGAQTEARLKQHTRTTIMLLAIILMYIFAELPQSILLLLCLSIEGFFNKSYMLLADTIDILALINNSANFIMYCAMSKQFRDLLCDYTCSVVRSKNRNNETRDNRGGYVSVKSAHTVETHHL